MSRHPSPVPPAHIRAADLALALAGGDVERATSFAEAQAAAANLAESREHWTAVAAEVRRRGTDAS